MKKKIKYSNVPMNFKVIYDMLPAPEKLALKDKIIIRKFEAKERAKKVRWLSAAEILKAKAEAEAGNTISLKEARRRIEGSARR